MKRNDE